MPFPKPPALEDEIVLSNLGHRSLKSAAGHGRKNDILKSSARRDGLDRAAATNAKETRECARSHPLHPTVLVGQNQCDRTSSPDLAGQLFATDSGDVFLNPGQPRSS